MAKEELKRFFPAGYEEACWETKAMSRKRGLQNEEDLLTLCMFYGYNHSLVEVQCYSKAKGIGEISDVGFMKRFVRCNDWFKWIIERIKPSQIIQYEKPDQLKDYNVIAVDGSKIVTKGKTPKTWHLHYAVSLFSLSCYQFKLTEETIGETLRNFELKSKDLVIADRAYATITGIEHCLKGGADFILRIRNNAFKIYNAAGDRIKFVDLLKDVRDNCKDFVIYYKNAENQMKSLRLCAVRKTDEEIKITEKRLHRKESRGQFVISDETKLSNQYFFVVTSLDDAFSAEEIINIYRLRWQVEIVFKRYKSILDLGSIPTRNNASCEAWLNCKMMIVLFCEKLMSLEDFSPSDEYGTKFMEGDEDCLPLDFEVYF